jgi:hypothetical protein
MRGISGRLTPVAVAVLLAACPAFAAQINFDNTAGTGVWETPANWSTDTLPTTADQPVIHDSFTASITSAQVAGDLVVSWPTGLGAPAAGTATLNIGPGANLVVGNPPDNTNTSGIRVGRTATAVGASLGVVNQTGGSVSIVTGANGLRLSQADAGTTVSDSRYVISGGTLRGGTSVNDTGINAPLNIGTQTNNFNRAEFSVLGSRATDIRFEDLNLRNSPAAAGTGLRQAVLSYTIDNGGVTPIVVEDQFDIQNHDNNGNPTGTVLLEINLQGTPAEADILLVSADRLTPTSGAAPFVNFTGLPDGSPIVRTFGNFIYTWNLDYTDGGDDGTLDASITLDFVSRTEVPEPGALAAAAAALAAPLLRRSRNPAKVAPPGAPGRRTPEAP